MSIITPYLINADGSIPNGLTLEHLTQLGLTPVFPTSPPVPAPGYKVKEAPPEKGVDSIWRQQWQEVLVEAPAPPSVPRSVTMRQARLALLGAGKLSAVMGILESLPEPERTKAIIEWEYSSEVFRNRELVLALGPALGLTPSQVDELFITASTL
jgi:hypothetical protein